MTVTEEKNNSNGFGKRLKSVIIDSSMTLEAFADSIGVSLSGVKKWISEESSPSLKYLLKITDVYHVNLDWLATGSGARDGGIQLYPEGLPIKVYDVKLSAGKGCFNRDEYIHSTITISNEMVKLYDLNSNCVGALVDGDSMEPKLHNGDIVIVDTAVNDIIADGIYAFYYDGSCLIKQLQKIGEDIKIKSLNPDYDSWVIEKDKINDFKIAGIFKARFSGTKI